jgi:hypothetical protein
MALKLWLSAGAFVALTTHLVYFLFDLHKYYPSGIIYYLLMKLPTHEIVKVWIPSNIAPKNFTCVVLKILVPKGADRSPLYCKASTVTNEGKEIF